MRARRPLLTCSRLVAARLLPVSLLLTAGGLGACAEGGAPAARSAPGGPAASSPDPASPAALATNDRAREASRGRAPKTPPAPRWNEPASGFPGGATDPELAPILDAIQRAAAAAQVPPPKLDPALFRVAESLAESARGTPSYVLVDYWMRHYGLIEPVPTIVSLKAHGQDGGSPGTPSLATAGQKLERELVPPMAKGRYTHVGVARHRERLVVALLQRRVQTEPIPRWLPLGQGLVLSGRLAPGYREPKVYRTTPDGMATTLAVRRGGGGAFTAQLICDAGPGPYQIEISGADRFGSSILAIFNLHCGAAPPPERPPADVAEPPVKSPEVAEDAILKLVNRDRARFGLAALVSDPQLQQVARSHSREMVEMQYVGHISPVTGPPAARVRRAGLKAGVVRENLARALGPREAERGLMDSPGHRANILARDITHVGVGVALGEMVGEKRELFVTQLFARFGSGVDPARTPLLLLAELGKRRRMAGLAPLVVDPGLTALARSYADLMARKDPSAQTLLRAELRKMAGRLKTAQALFVAASDPLSALDSRVLLEREFTLIGVAATETIHPTGAPVAGIALIVARGR